jgi:hypothetical protein
VRLAAALAVAAALLAAVPAGLAGTTPPTRAALVERATRVAKALPGWPSSVTPATAAHCPVPEVRQMTDRFAPAWYSPTGTPPVLEVDVTLGRWATSGTAGRVVQELGVPSRLACLKSTLKQMYKARYNVTPRVAYLTKPPAWAAPLPRGAHSLTARVDAAGQTYFNTTVMFVDPHDRQITWAIGFDYSTHLPAAALVARILRAAER